MSAWASLTGVLALTALGLGIAMLVVTTVHGGGSFGYIVGVLFAGAGAGRLYLIKRRREYEDGA